MFWKVLGGVESTKVTLWRVPGGAASTKVLFRRALGGAGSTKVLFWRAPGGVLKGSGEVLKKLFFGKLAMATLELQK